LVEEREKALTPKEKEIKQRGEKDRFNTREIQ
jgi:hypothetical protein